MFELTDDEALESIAQVWSVVRGWRSSFELSGVDPCEIKKVDSAFRKIDDIVSPELRRRLP